MIRSLKFALFLLAPLAAWSQSFKFRSYNERDGLSSRYVYSINQDEQGYLLIGTSEGLFRFDGFRFRSYTTKDSLSDNLIECSLKLGDGSTLFGHNNGDLTHYSRGLLRPIRLGQFFSSRITDLEFADNGTIWALSQNNGLVRIDAAWNPTHFMAGLEDYHLFALYPGKNCLWLGTDMGLVKAVIGQDQTIQAEIVDGIPLTAVTDLAPGSNGALLVATEDAGLFELDTAPLRPLIRPIQVTCEDISRFYIRQVRRDEQGNLWLCTNQQGLIQLSQWEGGAFHKCTPFREEGQEDSQSVRVSFHDRENNLWIGTIGRGLVKLEDDYFSTYTLSPGNEPTVYSLFERRDSLWAGLNGEVVLSVASPGSPDLVFGAEHGLPQAHVTAIHVDRNGEIWAGTFDSGLWRKGKRDRKFRRVRLSDDLLNQKINALLSEGSLLYVATDFGAYVLRGDEILMHLSIENGLSGNVIRSLFRDSKGRIWIGTTTSEITYIENGEIRAMDSPLPNSSFPVRCFAEDLQGGIWMGTEGMGVILLTGNEPRAFLKSGGLYSDFCYSLICDDKNRLWAGHRGAVSLIDLSENQISAKTPGSTGEVYFMDNASIRISGGSLIFGTNTGMLRYDPEQDKVNTFEPVLNIQSVLVSEAETPFDLPISLPYGDYKIEISFVGISLTRAEGVTYQFMLEGYDSDWSEPTTQSKATFNHLPPGSYVFKLKAFNSDGVGGSTIREIRITIDRPFWLKWWFITLCILISLMTIRIIILRRERFLKQNQEYLKKELAARTKEVVEQKELLEIKNKDITDSILYAKNIQKAILPPADALARNFPDAFVFYKPRDIVSGDFYWIERTGDKVLVVCADCTGHGVPGAFMSLIGSLLLKEIAINPDVTSPETFLSTLHHDLYTLLNRKMEDFSLEDGMDITILEFDTQSREVRLASANRPVLVYRDGTCMEVRGDRKTVGGGVDFKEEHFTLHSFRMDDGDSIYLFSDGITDQFGGEKGKKLKKAGLISILDEIHHLPMSAQRQMLKQRFNEWRGGLPQVDDVIMIGIRF